MESGVAQNDRVPLNRANVRIHMVRLGINSIAELSRRVADVDKSIERSYLSRVLKGDRPAQPSHVVALAKALQVPPIALLGPDDPAAALASLEVAS